MKLDTVKALFQALNERAVRYTLVGGIALNLHGISRNTLDIDLLLYDQVIVDKPELRVPHPRLRERAFVLKPLAELDPDLTLPDDGAGVGELVRRLPASPRARPIFPGTDLLPDPSRPNRS